VSGASSQRPGAGSGVDAPPIGRALAAALLEHAAGGDR
jgi:hypothetical protein